MHSNLFHPSQPSSDKLLIEHGVNDPSPMDDQEGENELHSSQFVFSEEEILSKDSNLASFYNMPPPMKSMSFLEKAENSMQSSLDLKGNHHFVGLKANDGLKQAINKMNYKKAKNILSEQLNEGENAERVQPKHDDPDNDDDLSPKTLWEREELKPPEYPLYFLENKDLYERLGYYYDKYPLLAFRMFLLKIKWKTQRFCYQIITNRIFEGLCLSVILWNTIMLFLDDPTTSGDVGNMFDQFFLIFYTVEMLLKIMALGLIWGKNAYLHSGWSWLDMSIVIVGFLPYVLSTDNNSFGVSVLRTLRVLRPLKTISTLKNLMMIIMTLFSSFPYILNTLLILFFFLLMYAIVGTQLLMGTLKRRCINKFTGLMIPQTDIQDSSYNGVMCGSLVCPDSDNNICSKLLQNPNSNITNFDNFLWSLLMMIQEITLENWSYNMYYVTRCFDYYGALTIFISLAFVGALILLNLMASVISSSYHEQAQKTITHQKPARLYNENVQEFLEYKRNNRIRKSFTNTETRPCTNEIRDQDVKDVQVLSLTVPLEIELQEISRKTEEKRDIKYLVQQSKIQNLISLEEMVPFFEPNGEIRKSPKTDNDTPNATLSHKTNSGEKVEDPQNKKPNHVTKSFNEDVTCKTNQNFDIGRISSNAGFGTLNQLNLMTEPDVNRKSEKPLLDPNTIKDRISWLRAVSLTKIFRKTPLVLTQKQKFRDWKMMVDHNKEYVSSSTADVVAKSIELQCQREEEQFRQKILRTKFEVSYQHRQNFQLNKKEIKDKYEREVTKQFIELDERKANHLVKKIYFYDSLHQIRVPLKIQSDSFVFQAKMENILERSYKKKKNAFRNMFQRQPRKSVIGKKRQRLKSLIFSEQEIKSSMKEKLYVPKSITELEKEFSNKRDYRLIRVHDIEKGLLCEDVPNVMVDLGWSGKDILEYSEIKDMNIVVKVIKQEASILLALSTISQDTLIWMEGCWGKIEMARKSVRTFVEGKLFEWVMLLVICLNTIDLAMNGSLTDPDQVKLMEAINEDVVYVFISEMILKIFGYGLDGYLRSPSNLFDGTIVVISVVDLIESSMNAKVTALRSLRIVRVMRILRPLEYMKVITRVLVSKFSSFIYICLLLVLFISIYTLIGNQIYINQLDNKSTGIRQNFDTLYFSFLSVFQLVSIENWNDIETITMYSSVPQAFTVFFLLSLIFFGNYVFLNLFLGVLLDGFSSGSSEDSDEDSSQGPQSVNLDELNRFKNIYHEDENIDNKKKLMKLSSGLSLNSENVLLSTLEGDDMDRALTDIVRVRMISTFENPFQEWHCEESLWLFNKHDFLRRCCFVLVSSKVFRNFILLVIIGNSVKLAIDTYIDGQWSDIFDYCLGSVLVLEAFTKIVALGFATEPNTYLRDYWNVLDFLITIGSVVDMSLTNYNLHYIKIFLLIRTLKLLSVNASMRLVVSALVKSVGPLINLIIFTFLIFMIFALIGINLLADRMGVCFGEPGGNYIGINKLQCLNDGGTWLIWDANFDNIFHALITVFILCTQENWPFIMYTSMDSNSSDIGPITNNYKYVGFYFVFALLVLNFFLINLFVGVLCDQFLEAKAKSDPLLFLSLTDSQRQWIEFQQFIPKLKPRAGSRQENKKKNRFREAFEHLVESQTVEIFLLLCIIGNIVTLAMNFEGQTPNYVKNLETINLVFTGVFIAEALLKILALGFVKYLSSAWNIFDFLIVATSISEIIINNLSTNNNNLHFLRMGPQIIRILRILRVLRVLKLIKRLESLKKLLETLVSALPQIANVGLLYFLVFYIYAIIGVMLFKDITIGQQIDDNNNFSNAGTAIVLCFKMVTGENWWQLMFDCYRLPPNCDPARNCGSSLAPLYFMSFQVVAGFIVQSLFVLVILQTLEKANEESTFRKFKDIAKNFKTSWSIFARKEDPFRIKVEDLMFLFRKIPEPLGFKNAKNLMQVAVEIMKMDFETDNSDNVYFYDVFFGALKRMCLVESEGQDSKEETLTYLDHLEISTREKIKALMRRSHKEREGAMIVGVLRRLANKKKTANPMIKILWRPVLFKTWRRYTILKKDGRLSEDEEESKCEKNSPKQKGIKRNSLLDVFLKKK